VGLTLPVTQRGDELGIKFSNTYGSSECYALMSFHDWQADAAQRAKSGGVPIDPEIGVRVADPESGRICAEGEPGEIQIRGPNLLSGYLNNPEATSKAMTADGWFRSGDLGFMEGAGFVYLARMGDSLRLRGYLVNPAEIENCLMEHTSVGGAQVVGVNRPGEGDMAVAYVIAGTGVPDEAMLIAHCRERMASYKVPRRVILIDEFPAINGPNGNKIQKRVLREWAAAAV
jgi:fatty-acyl-CoA synthase